MANSSAAKIATLTIGACLLTTLFNGLSLLSDDDDSAQQIRGGRRSLLAKYMETSTLRFLEADTDEGVYPWAKHHLVSVRDMVNDITDTEKENYRPFLFWHIPKSGGSTAKTMYRCLGLDIDIRSQPETIRLGTELNLVQSGMVDIFFSSFPDYAIDQMFDPAHKGRVLAMFRDPVDRLTSKFFYLQIATWEKTYRPEWKDMDVLDWVKDVNIDNNHMVKKLAGKVQKDLATELDFQRAKETIRKYFIVGLMNEMEESFNRFNTVMNINADTNDRYEHCMDVYFGDRAKKSNTNKHPKIDQDSPAYQLLVEQNSFDLQLHEYIIELFEEQKENIEGYAKSAGSSEASVSSEVDIVVEDVPEVQTSEVGSTDSLSGPDSLSKSEDTPDAEIDAVVPKALKENEADADDTDEVEAIAIDSEKTAAEEPRPVQISPLALMQASKETAKASDKEDEVPKLNSNNYVSRVATGSAFIHHSGFVKEEE